MPITQDRLINLIQAAHYYRERDKELRKALREANEAPDRAAVLDDVALMAYDQEDAETFVLLVKEDLHFKHMRVRNDRTRLRQQALRDLAAGLPAEIPGPTRYQRRNTPRSGYTREASLEPPALPKKLSQKMTEGYTPEEIQAARPAAPSPNLKGRPLFEPGYDPNFVPSLFGKTPK